MPLRLRAAQIGFTALLVATASTPAPAEGFLEALFGGFRRPAQQTAPVPANAYSASYATSYADPASDSPAPRSAAPIRSAFGSSRGFCVRTCDGRYFPVVGHAGASAAETCRSFCPASKTMVFSGSKIESAVANDGTRYTDLDNAFVHRTKVVEGCTCNGRDAFGLMRMDATADATLRNGDIVATANGMVAFTGSRGGKSGNFTPVSDSSLSKVERDRLTQMPIMPVADASAPITPVTDLRPAVDAGRRQASR